ncbi:MAG: M48 family metalloprotease [Thermoanaerobaculia bacterium]
MKKRSLTLLLALVVVAGCSTNPATGKREFNIVSEQQEIAIGRQAHQQVEQEFGVYTEKPELTRRVQEVGARLAANSDRPNLPWHFTILDTPMVNAMALPGGYVYITRGMLERINSDDELAGVLGHEITHVTARHAAEQISRSQLAQFGLVLGAVVAGPEAAQQYGQLAQVGLQLLFQKYSRSQESQADRIGTKYVAESGFNPIGSERMLMTLARMDTGPSSPVDRYFASHPDPAKRVRDVKNEVQQLRAEGIGNYDEPVRARYVPLVDGIITGNSTQRVVIRDGTIYDREHGLIIRAPSGWQPVTQPGLLFAMEPNSNRSGANFVAQEVENKNLQGRNAQDAIRSKLQQMGLRYVGSREASTRSGQRFPIDVWTGQTQSGPVGVETTQFPHGDHVAVFMFITPGGVSRTQSPLGTILENTTEDLTKARAVAPPRLDVRNVRRGESWSDLARAATGNPKDAKAVANINGFDPTTPPPAGMPVKLPSAIAQP